MRVAQRVRPDATDPLKVRRFMALWCAFYGIFLWPYIISYLSVHFKLSDEVAVALITYMGAICATPIGGYLYAAVKNQQSDAPGAE